jgi:hypothetical protein
MDQAEPSPVALARTPTTDVRGEVPALSTAAASPGWPGGFAPPSLDLAAPAVTWPEPGASPALARPSAPANTTLPVSRLADLPLASRQGALRETEATPAATDTTAPSSGAVGTAVPAAPPAAAAPEGDVDKLADRVWQVIQRRLEVERERQRGLP